MPEEQINKPFEKLFKFLLEKGLVTLGLYRLAGASDNYYSYVYTNPSQNRKTKLIVTQKDRVFVLGKNIPKELIIDYSIKQTKKADPMETESGKMAGADPHNPSLAKNKDFYGIRQTGEEQATARISKSPMAHTRARPYELGCEEEEASILIQEGGRPEGGAHPQLTSA